MAARQARRGERGRRGLNFGLDDFDATSNRSAAKDEGRVFNRIHLLLNSTTVRSTPLHPVLSPHNCICHAHLCPNFTKPNLPPPRPRPQPRPVAFDSTRLLLAPWPPKRDCFGGSRGTSLPLALKTARTASRTDVTSPELVDAVNSPRSTAIDCRVSMCGAIKDGRGAPDASKPSAPAFASN